MSSGFIDISALILFYESIVEQCRSFFSSWIIVAPCSCFMASSSDFKASGVLPLIALMALHILCIGESINTHPMDYIFIGDDVAIRELLVGLAGTLA